MKRGIGLTAILFIIAFSAGCPYTTKAPLGVPDREAFDPRLVGLWEGFDGDEYVGLIRVFAFNDAEYYIEAGGDGDEDDDERGDGPDRYRAFMFKIGGQSFLHINELGAGDAKLEYCFARFAFSDKGGLEMRFVGDEIAPKSLATDPAALKEFLASHLDDPALDDEDVKLLLRRRL